MKIQLAVIVACITSSAFAAPVKLSPCSGPLAIHQERLRSLDTGGEVLYVKLLTCKRHPQAQFYAHCPQQSSSTAAVDIATRTIKESVTLRVGSGVISIEGKDYECVEDSELE